LALGRVPVTLALGFLRIPLWGGGLDIAGGIKLVAAQQLGFWPGNRNVAVV
jgi:hypothetical protein